MVEWMKIYDNGIISYEGFTLNGKPYGAGTTYYGNGNKHKEGIFNIKGFVCGRIFYPNGKLRFEGKYSINQSYGPNYPAFGEFYNENGECIYSGVFHCLCGGVGYRTVKEPKNYCKTEPQNALKVPVLMWEDLKNEQR